MKRDLLKIQTDSQTQQKDIYKDMDTFMTQIGSQIDNCQKELLLKASLKDMCQLLDQKVSVTDCNKALAEIEKEMTLFVKDDKLKTWTDDQSLITEALCAENCVARWVWKSGELLQGQQIPWEV